MDDARFALSDDAAAATRPYADHMNDAIRSLLAEPKVPNAPARAWRDWVLVAIVIAVAVLELFIRDDVVWPPVSFALTIVLAFALPFRRSNPLAALGITFGIVALIDVIVIVSDVGQVGLNSLAFLLVLPYALFRWGSGREAAIGLGFMLLLGVLGNAADYTGIAETIFGTLFLLFPAVLGGAIRYRASSRLRELDQIKLLEREHFSRELHDTVAHHVSAIVIQAQAGRTVANSDPKAAVNALVVIEGAALRALADLRVMVGALREGEEPDLAPQRGVADIQRLADGFGDTPRVEVELSGDLDRLSPSIDAAIYRLAQESITNAIRHARHATYIAVSVIGEPECVRMIVSDDGDGSLLVQPSSGFGLVGMIERASLLGGTLEAGPNRGKGWQVTAVLPKAGSVS